MTDAPLPEPPAASDGVGSWAGRQIGAATSRGVRLSLAAQVFIQVGSMVATVILARLLHPSDFGIIAVSQSILGFASLLSLSGVNAALITRRGDIDTAASTYFWLASAIGFAGLGIFAILARPIADALGQSEAAPYVAVLAISFPLGLLSLVPLAMLQRKFRFGWLNGSAIASSVCYFTLEITLALVGWGAWSVISGQVVGAAVGLGVSLIGARWRPRLSFSWSYVRSDLSLTAGLGAGQALAYIQKNADYWAVSSILGGPVLGVYYVAYVLPNVIRLRITAAMTQVLLPTYSAAGTVGQTATLWRRTFPAMAGLGLPVLVGIALVAAPLVQVFFGSQWSGAVAPMRILTMATVVDLFLSSVATLAVVQRRIRRYVTVLAVRALSTAVLALLAAVMWRSIVAVAFAVLISAVVTAVVQELILSRPLGVGIRTVAGQLTGYLALTGLMAAAVSFTGLVMPQGAVPVALLAIQVTVGVAVYVGIGWLVARPLLRPVLVDVRRVARGR